MSFPFPITLAEAATSHPGVFTYFAQADLAGKVIAIVLVFFSLLAWTVMIGKYLDLSRMRDLNRAFENKMRQADSAITMKTSGLTGPYARLMDEAQRALQRYGAVTPEGTRLSIELQMGHVENALQREVAQVTARYESKMVLLGSMVSGAPFMGLLGTVWGVMDAFGGMALRANATLQALAPGVSGALLTTVCGLLVAIPSVFGYNFLLTQAKVMILELENFASALADRVELELTAAQQEEQV